MTDTPIYERVVTDLGCDPFTVSQPANTTGRAGVADDTASAEQNIDDLLNHSATPPTPRT